MRRTGTYIYIKNNDKKNNMTKIKMIKIMITKKQIHICYGHLRYLLFIPHMLI